MAPTDWRSAQIVEVSHETPHAATLTLELPDWHGHRAGQHVDVRLTAEDGYQAQRRYSIASAPGAPLQITVERLDDGEVSPWFVGEARAGDSFELRGPFGGWFVWEPPRTLAGGAPPLQLIGGGSGLVPLMSMLRARRGAGSDVPARLLLSSRGPEDVLYAAELATIGAELIFTYTRRPPPDWAGYARRVDRAMLAEVTYEPAAGAQIYVCGPTPFVEAVANDLVTLGHGPTTIRAERFGATGS